MGRKQKYTIFLYFSCRIAFGLAHLTHQSGSLLYIGEFRYRSVISFVKGNQSCGFASQNISSIFNEGVNIQEASTSDYTCLTFLENYLMQDNTFLRITSVTAKIQAYDTTYTFTINPFNCTTRNNLQNIKLFLTCVKQKEIVGKACTNGKGCNQEREICRFGSIFEQKICTPKRRYNESCNMHSQCYGNTHCEETGREFLCQCKEGFEFINGECLRGKRRLYEPCEVSSQCRGSTHAAECRTMEGVKLCYCSDGYDIFKGACIKVRKTVGESCWIGEQCTGTKNAQQCKPHNETGKLICDCNPGFLRHGSQCLQANRTLYEDCLLDSQCNGTRGMGVCKKVRDRGICVCASSFVEDRDSLRCRKAKKNIFEPCKIDEQCTGTENAKFCRFDEQRKKNVCTCEETFIRLQKICIKSARKIFESCKYDMQCTGTSNANRCKSVGDDKICHCNIGHIEFEGKCVKDGRRIDDTCEIDLQCNGTKHAGVCGENRTCICDVGFLARNKDCIPDKMPLSRIQEKKNQFLFVGAGGMLFGISISTITCLIVYTRKRKSLNERLDVHPASSVSDDNNYYAYAVHGNFRDVAGRQISPSRTDSSNIGDVYDTAHHTEEQASENLNLYDVSDLSTFRGQHSSENMYMYNHLHEKETQLCENLYDISEAIPVSSNIDT